MQPVSHLQTTEKKRRESRVAAPPLSKMTNHGQEAKCDTYLEVGGYLGYVPKIQPRLDLRPCRFECDQSTLQTFPPLIATG